MNESGALIRIPSDPRTFVADTAAWASPCPALSGVEDMFAISTTETVVARNTVSGAFVALMSCGLDQIRRIDFPDEDSVFVRSVAARDGRVYVTGQTSRGRTHSIFLNAYELGTPIRLLWSERFAASSTDEATGVDLAFDDEGRLLLLARYNEDGTPPFEMLGEMVDPVRGDLPVHLVAALRVY